MKADYHLATCDKMSDDDNFYYHMLILGMDHYDYKSDRSIKLINAMIGSKTGKPYE